MTIKTLTNGGDVADTTTTGTREASAAELSQVFGEPQVDLDLSDDFTPMPRDDGYVHPSVQNRRRRANRSPVSPFLPGNLRAEIEISWPSPPTTVFEAQRAAHEAITRLEDAGHAVKTVSDDQALERARHEAAVAKAFREQAKTPKAPSTDWIAVAEVRRLEYDEAVRLAKDAVRAFGAAREAAATEWLASLIDQIEPALTEARTALHAAAKALRHHRAAVDGAHRMSLDTGAYGPTWHQSSSRLNVAKAMAGLSDLLALVDSDDAVVTGEFLTRTDDDAKLSPPAWTRQAMRRRADLRPGGEDFVALAEIEAADMSGEIAPCARGHNVRV